MVAMHVECIGTAYEILIQNVQSVNHLLLFNYISFLGGERYNCINYCRLFVVQPFQSI